MSGSVAQLRVLRFLPVSLHEVWVVPQQLVHCTIETAAALWNRVEHTLHE